MIVSQTKHTKNVRKVAAELGLTIFYFLITPFSFLLMPLARSILSLSPSLLFSHLRGPGFGYICLITTFLFSSPFLLISIHPVFIHPSRPLPLMHSLHSPLSLSSFIIHDCRGKKQKLARVAGGKGKKRKTWGNHANRGSPPTRPYVLDSLPLNSQKWSSNIQFVIY